MSAELIPYKHDVRQRDCRSYQSTVEQLINNVHYS